VDICEHSDKLQGSIEVNFLGQLLKEDPVFLPAIGQR
jgi:hypothetical protein